MKAAASLPVPDNIVFQHSYKQAQRGNETSRLRPPKLKPRHAHYDSNFNRSHSLSSTAVQVSFRGSDGGGGGVDGGSGYSELSAAMLPLPIASDETYFEQSFTSLAKIGEGSFGEVFKVRSRTDGRLYAVKMSKQLFRSEHYRQERLEEVRRYEQFSGQANCVRFYRAWEQDDRLYMQMELCRESLESYLERRRQIPEQKIWHILLDLLLALKSLHDRNLIHLDIKLDNVLIGDDYSCKLADFGLVIDVDRANRHQATEGDSRYIAPEIMQGHFSKAADIFSLGIAMLELSCCLELPSNGPLWQQLRSGILPEDFIKSISPEMQVIIREMMTPEPQARPTVDQLLSHKKFVSILQRRSRWELVKKVKQSIRKSRRVAWSKLCNLKSLIFRLFASLLTTLKLHAPAGVAAKKVTTSTTRRREVSPRQSVGVGVVPVIRTQLLSSTPSSGDSSTAGECAEFLMDASYYELSQQGTPSNFAADKIVVSTPVNHNSFRSRKDLTKTNFQTVPEAADSDNLIDRRSSFLSLDDMESSHSQSSFMRKHLDTSSLRRKKLFLKGDEDSD